ncbi:MAG: gliding motility-associated C-terminal domain-containing protein [Bacteroidota bacterium]|nr:gliding motility-associated C-terminal domain-containing protein [Bacteroidota bacterium]
MKKIFTFFSTLLISGFLIAQNDLALAPPNGTFLSPVSGCALTANENVTVRIFNFGPGAILTSDVFQVSYTINGGPLISESVTGASIPLNTSYTYTFAAQADLSVQGSYSINATVSLPGDPTPGNDTYSGYIVNSLAPSNGGVITGPSSVCISGNSGFLTLGAHNGSILRWEYSTDGGSTWINISNTSTIQNYTNLTVPTMYRAVVQNGSCASANSAPLSIAIDPVTVAGNTSGAATVCSGTNSGNVTLSGNTGSIINWELSTDGGFTWNPVANTTTTLSYLNITQTTRYRAVVRSGSCSPANSSITTITVNPPTIPGSLTPNATTVCSGANSGTITLSGQSGSIVRWEFSINSGITWTNIVNTTTTQSYTNLTATRLYRVRVQSAGCPALYSDTATVTINPPTVAGTLSSSATVCSGSNSGTMSLSGFSGGIVRWEFSINSGSTWTNIANITNTENYTNLTTTTSYRVRVQNGICPALYSNTIDITVNPLTVGGSIAGTTTVCGTTNSGSLTLGGNTGGVQQWESSIDNGTTWNTIANTTTSENYSNLSNTTWFRASLQSGVCAQAYSDTAIVTVAPATVAGILSAAATVCSGTNSGTLTLAGHSGSIVSWEFSTNSGSTWTNIVNTATTQNYTNLTTTTRYRVRVQNGGCPALYSNSIDITVNPLTVGGTVAGTTTYCSPTNSGSLTLSGHTGSIQSWESSDDNGISWNTIANTSTTENYTNLTTTTWYRASVQSGVCAQAYSDTAIVTIAASTSSGTLSASATVCSGANTGTLTLAGYTGVIVEWEFSTDAGVSWTTIANTTDTESYNNLTTTTRYRVRVQNGSCPALYSNTVDITVDPEAVGGAIAGGTTVCATNNSGTLTLSGYLGNILEWESSTDGGATWNSFANTTSTHAYSNLSVTTAFRAVIQSGVCPIELSDEDTVIVDPVTVGGTVSGATTVCSGANSGNVTLVGNTGDVLNWEFSTDNGNSWISISNTTTTQGYNNITTATMYRARLQSGLCSPAYSGTALVNVDQQSVGGTIYGAATVCSGSNSGTLSLIGNSGNIIEWEESNDGITWASITNTTNTHNYNNLISTTYFRATAQNGVCTTDYSSIVIINVDANSVGGTASGNTTVCSGANTGTVSLTGETGNVIGWEFSTDNGTSWINLSNTTTSQNYSNLTVTTMYRAKVKNGVCNPVNSLEATITVDQASNAGVLTQNAVVCSGANNGTLTLSGYVGNIIDWEESNGGVIWSPTGNTSNTHTYNNLFTITYYRAIVLNGSVCGEDTSNIVVITVNPNSVGGNLTGSNSVCPGNNIGTLNLTGETGDILGWERSTDDGNNWMPISNTTDSLVYNNITQTSYYRVLVKSGICNAAYSDTVIVTVSPQSVAGTISGSTTICPGESGNLTLNGYTGSILDWESSTNGGSTWSSTGNNMAVYTYSNLQDTTIFRAIVISGSCPSDTSLSAYVNVFAKPQASFTASDVCFGNTVSFQNTSAISSGSVQLNMWNFGDGIETVANSPSHNYSAPGDYLVLLKTVSNNNCIDTVSATVTIFEVPSAKISSSAGNDFCAGDNIVLSVISDSALTYQWSNGSLLASLVVENSGTYSVTVTNPNTSCSATDSIQVVAIALPVAFAGRDTSVAPGKSIQLNATGGITYQWTPSASLDFPNDANPIASPAATTIYTVMVSNENGCTSFDSLTVEVKGKADFFVSNLITPNGDGFNDTWYIENIELFPANEVVVFNRNGQTVFSASSYDNTWNGTYNGKELPDGTYYYILKFTNSDDSQKGSVNILRNQQ